MNCAYNLIKEGWARLAVAAMLLILNVFLFLPQVDKLHISQVLVVLCGDVKAEVVASCSTVP